MFWRQVLGSLPGLLGSSVAESRAREEGEGTTGCAEIEHCTGVGEEGEGNVGAVACGA